MLYCFEAFITGGDIGQLEYLAAVNGANDFAWRQYLVRSHAGSSKIAIDRLVGLKENVILGHLIPAGTGFRSFQESEVRYRPEALQVMSAPRVVITDLRVAHRSVPVGDDSMLTRSITHTESITLSQALNGTDSRW